MDVLKTIENGIVRLTINRENALNALNQNVMSLLDQFVTEIESQYESIKGVIITGSGQKAFVAGADITEFINLDAKSGTNLSQFGRQIFDRIERLPVPVIAAVNGFALGGGCELAMACHIRIASSAAKFGQPEVNLGLIPGYSGTQRLVRYLGRAKATELILTGDMLSASEALTLGLINHLTEPGEEINKAIEIIEKISKKGPSAVASSLKCVHEYFAFEGQGAELESELFGQLMEGVEAKEGINAFLEKRKPVFRQ